MLSTTLGIRYSLVFSSFVNDLINFISAVFLIIKKRHICVDLM